MPRRALAAVLLAASLLGAACSGDDDSTVSAPEGSSAEEEHNDADVQFAQDMIVHHRQAIEMAQLAPDRAATEEVRDLAARIEAAQAPEIEQMTAWLEAWGEDVPADGDMEDMEGMDMGGDDMEGMGSSAGMMSSEDMTSLEEASGPEFDRLFMELMIVHHEGAIEMAEAEIEDGRYPDAIAVAEEIVATQQGEIDEMNELLSAAG